MAERFEAALSLQEAAALKTADSAFLAGGTEINRLGSLVSPSVLISIRKIKELKKLEITDDQVFIGAGCTFQEILENEAVPEYIREACRFMGSRTKRNMATIGGNISLCRDDSYLLPTLLAAGGMLSLMKEDGTTEEISLEDYVSGRQEYENRLILSVTVPGVFPFAGSVRHANTVESNARLTLSLCIRDGKYRAAAGIKKAGLFVFPDLSEKLEMDPSLSEAELIAWAKERELPISDDKIFGSAEYIRYLLGASFARLLRDYGKGGRT